MATTRASRLLGATLLFFSVINTYSFELVFNNHILLEKQGSFENIPVGGLSGIRFQSSHNKLLAISDDRSKFGPARFYVFDVSLVENKVQVKLVEQNFLKDDKDQNFKKSTIDFEDIDFLNEEEMLVSDEGSSYATKIYPPRLVVFDIKTRKYKRDLLVDEKFTPKRVNGHIKSGVRDNLSFEAISISPTKKSLFFSSEDALIQDGPVASLRQNSHVRISQYLNKGSGLTPAKEFVYNLGPIQTLDLAVTSVGAQTGIPAILAIDDSSLLVLERTYYPLVDQTKLLLFKALIGEDSIDYTSTPSLIKSNPRSLKKDIIFDFDLIIKNLNPEYQFLDNVEGMCLGPKLPNGNDTLILVSDDNFSKSQRTHFIVMEIKK